MCGIFAFFGKNKGDIKNCNTLSKRGPDDMVIISNDIGTFIFTRLAINDPSSLGNQPMCIEDTMLMCNGEIYNHKYLEHKYKIKCNSGSDCEVILHLYKKIGFTETIAELDGVYGIVLFDKDKVYVARDPIGVRPLYYGFNDSQELTVCSIPNLISDSDYVSQFNPGNAYLYDLQFKTFTCIYKYYITPSLPQLDPVCSIRTGLINATRKRLMTDRPIGCLLSGGLDSSIITAILARLIGPKNVRTYSIGMEGSVDLQHARIVADYLGTDHHEVKFTPEEGFAIIPEVIEALGTFDITTVRASVGMYLISRFISMNSKDKVILSGEGADEIFCGYLYFHNAPSVEEANAESYRLISELHHYDVLRADRSVSCHGLELRVPFLDKEFMRIALSTDRTPKNGIEKGILREAFKDFLPSEIINRRKDGFSDGVSNANKTWYQYIQEFVEPKIDDHIYDRKEYISKEAMYYKLVFNRFFPNLKIKKEYWMPRWTDVKDPSGRLIKVD